MPEETKKELPRFHFDVWSQRTVVVVTDGLDMGRHALTPMYTQKRNLKIYTYTLLIGIYLFIAKKEH